MHLLDVLQALGRPVLLDAALHAFRDAGVVLRPRPGGHHLVDFPPLTQIHLGPTHGATVLLPCGERLRATAPRWLAEPWRLSFVDDSRVAAEAGAHLLIHLGLPLEEPHHLPHHNPEPHGTTPRPASEA